MLAKVICVNCACVFGMFTLYIANDVTSECQLLKYAWVRNVLMMMVLFLSHLSHSLHRILVHLHLRNKILPSSTWTLCRQDGNLHCQVVDWPLVYHHCVLKSHWLQLIHVDFDPIHLVTIYKKPKNYYEIFTK